MAEHEVTGAAGKQAYTLSQANPPVAYIRVDPSGVVHTLTVATEVTSNTTTAPVLGVSGVKNFQWKVSGTGAVTQTVVLKGSFDSDGSSPTDLCTITLSGTAPVYDVCGPFTAPFPYLFVTTTNTTGTGASGTGRVGY